MSRAGQPGMSVVRAESTDERCARHGLRQQRHETSRRHRDRECERSRAGLRLRPHRRTSEHLGNSPHHGGGRQVPSASRLERPAADQTAAPFGGDAVREVSVGTSRAGRGRVWRDQPVPERAGHGGGAAVDVEFGEEIARVRAGGVDADVEPVGDFFGGEAFDHQGEQFALARGERDG